MEAVIYGVIFKAKIDICENEPPVNWLKKSSELFCANHSEMTVASTPGTGS